MTGRPTINRARLIELPAGTELLREIRYARDSDFDDLTTEELERGARWLRAASYSATEGARKLERIARTRETPNDQQGQTCTFDSTPNETSTTTAEPPTATPPPPGPS